MNIVTAPLRTGTVLSNVRYKWVSNGVPGPVQNNGITQPDSRFAMFRINDVSPVGAEEIIVFDATDGSNWNTIPVI